MLWPLLQQLRSPEHEQQENQSAYMPRILAEVTESRRTWASQRCLCPTSGLLRSCRDGGSRETEPPLQTAPSLRLSRPRRWYHLTHLCLGVTEGTFAFSLLYPLNIFITNKEILFPPALIGTAVRLENCDVTVGSPRLPVLR